MLLNCCWEACLEWNDRPVLNEIAEVHRAISGVLEMKPALAVIEFFEARLPGVEIDDANVQIQTGPLVRVLFVRRGAIDQAELRIVRVVFDGNSHQPAHDVTVAEWGVSLVAGFTVFSPSDEASVRSFTDA